MTPEAINARRKVLAARPGSVAFKDPGWRVYADAFSRGSLLGKGPTEDAAWIRAAEKIERGMAS